MEEIIFHTSSLVTNVSLAIGRALSRGASVPAVAGAVASAAFRRKHSPAPKYALFTKLPRGSLLANSMPQQNKKSEEYRALLDTYISIGGASGEGTLGEGVPGSFRHEDNQRPVDDQHPGCDSMDLPTKRQRLLGQD